MQRELLNRPRADARDRAQPPPRRARDRGCAGPRVPRATSRAARTSTSAREPARSKDCEQRRRRAGQRRRRGQVAQTRDPPVGLRASAVPATPPRGARSPPPARPRSAAPQIAQASASNGSGRRLTRSHGRRRTEAPISGSRRKRRRNARRSSSTPSANRIRAMPWAAAARLSGARSEQNALGRGLRDPHHHGLLAVVKQAFEHAAATPQHPVHARLQRQPEGPRRAAPPRVSPRPRRSCLQARRPAGAQSRPPSRCTSTSSERLPTIWTSSPAFEACALVARTAAEASPAATGSQERGGVAVAAADQADDRGSRHEAAGGHRGGLHGRNRDARGAPVGGGRARQRIGMHDGRPHPRARAARRFPRYRRSAPTSACARPAWPVARPRNGAHSRGEV